MVIPVKLNQTKHSHMKTRLEIKSLHFIGNIQCTMTTVTEFSGTQKFPLLDNLKGTKVQLPLL